MKIQEYDKNNKNHVLISCGDLLDRGPDAFKCLKFINELPEENRVLIKGNHEYLIEDIFERGYFCSHDNHNGTTDTIFQLGGSYNINDCKENFLLQNYLQSCVDFFEIEKYIFVHGWIPCIRNDKVAHHSKNIVWTFDPNWRNGNWEDASWYCGFDAWANGIKVPDKTIVCGHWHTSYGHSKYHNDGAEFDDLFTQIHNRVNKNKLPVTAKFDIFKDDGIIALDACTVYSHKVNVLKIGRQKALSHFIIEDNRQVSLFD